MTELPLSNQISDPKSRARWVIWIFGLGISLLASCVIVFLALGTFLNPATNIYTMRSSLVWAPIGPHLVVLSLLALAFALPGLRRGPRRVARAAVVVAAMASVASTFITARIAYAIYGAGGSVNLFLALLVSSVAVGPPDLRETYTSAEGQPLEALIYRPARAGVGSNGAPVMVYIHGGGWVFGRADMAGANLRWYADNGWLVVSVDYRLATDGHPTWDKAPSDVGCAMVWTARNAERLGGDAKHMVLIGESAGANLAINLSYAAASGKAESGCGGAVPVPEATVAAYPVVDPKDAYDAPFPFPGSSAQWFIASYIGGSPAEFPERMRAISSDTYLSNKAPRTLILEPELDALIPPKGVYGFVDRARAAGVDVTLARIPFANHGFDLSGLVRLPAANSLGNQSRSIVLNYLKQR
jgi:acetyl esterase